MDASRTVLVGLGAALVLLALLAPTWTSSGSADQVSVSPDGGTYLEVERQRCFAGVDGVPTIETLIPVRPGVRTVQCQDATHRVVVEEGTTFHFAGCRCPW